MRDRLLRVDRPARAGGRGRRAPGALVRAPGPRAAARERPVGRRPLRHAEGRGEVELDDRRGRDAPQHPVEDDDLLPVGLRRGRRLAVDRRDRRLQLEGSDRPAHQRLLDEAHAARDRTVVPQRAVLGVERDEVASGVRSCRRARVVDQQQGEQAGGLGITRQRPVEPLGEAQRLALEVDVDERVAGGARVAGGEGEVDDVPHRVQARHGVLLRRRGEGSLARPDRRLGPADPLRHRRLGHEEAGRDLCGRQAGSVPQGERHPGGIGQVGVGAEHRHPQGVVIDRRPVDEASGVADGGPAPFEQRCGGAGLALLPALTGTRGALGVDEPAGGHPDEPRLGVVGPALARPLLRRGEQRLLDRVLAGPEVAAAPQQGGEDVSGVLPPDVLSPGHCSSPPGHIVGRISIVSPGPAKARPSSSARSRSATSTRKKPANCSLVSA